MLPKPGMADFDLIIFDCDGTLVDSEALNCAASIELLKELGITHYSLEEYMEQFTGLTLTASMIKVQMDTGKILPADLPKRYVAKVSEMQQTGLVAVEGAKDLVARAWHGKACVASNGERMNVIESLRMTDLFPPFTEETVFTKIQVKNPKPYPDLFLFAAAQMGVEPERCLVIEDSVSGVRAGVAAGMTTWGFTGSAHDPVKQQETLKSAGAHEIFSRLIHIQEKLAL